MLGLWKGLNKMPKIDYKMMRYTRYSLIDGNFRHAQYHHNKTKRELKKDAVFYWSTTWTDEIYENNKEVLNV
jgi:hypothetical protein